MAEVFSRGLVLLAASAALLGSAIGLSACSAGVRTKTSAQAPDALHDLAGMETLQRAFNRDSGSYRLVLLLSPT